MGQKRSFYQTQIKIGKQPEQLDSTITAITAAMPPVATDDNHGLETGDVVFLQSDYHGANGFFTVKKQGDNAFELVGQDFRGAGTIGNVKYQKVEMSGFCDATGIDVEPATISFSEVTTNCDNYPKEEGELEAGSMSMEIYYDPEEPMHQLLEGAMFSQESLYVQTKPKGVMILRGFVVAVESWKYSGKVKEKYSGSVGFKIQSRPHDVRLTA